MKILYYFPWLMLLCACESSQSYRILGLFPWRGKSHFVMFERLMKGLADKGHQVDVVSTFPQKQPYPNYRDLVVLPVTQDDVTNNMSYTRMTEVLTKSIVHTISTLGGNDMCKYLGYPAVHNLIHNAPKDPPYDLVVTEILSAHCFVVFGHLYDVPVIGMSSSTLYPWMHDILANPDNLAITSNILINYVSKMNFLQRVYNFVVATYSKHLFNYWTTEQDTIIEQYVGPGMPSVRELERKIALIFVNSYMSLNGIAPMTPALVEVGGLHVHDDGQEIAQPLAKWLNESKDGFIYFSFGSMVKTESFPRHVLNVFYRSIAKIAPIRVLMKIPNPEELPSNLPSNVFTYPWIPQLKVLKHRNIKAFITHGGLMGTQEAITCGVPMIGIPLFADQFNNVDLYVSQNIALKLDYSSMTEQDMDTALKTILQDPSYRINAKKLSAKFLDRPMKPLDTAIFWVEYIIRYGSDALRSPALDLTTWQVQLLDVYAFLLLISAVLTYVLIKLAYVIVDLFGGRHAGPFARSKKTD